MKKRNSSSDALVSVHGGHSREFGDADESALEEIVCAYIHKGFKWVGITEHIPPVSADFLWPWDIEKGHTAPVDATSVRRIFFRRSQAPGGVSGFHSHVS